MPSITPGTGKTYWRSLNELADKPEFREFVEREFPSQASEFTGAGGGGEGRRTFLKIMGASVALAGLASCRRWPEEKLAPYAHRPANRMDGVPVHYATACEIAGMGYGVLAVSFDGRPIKVDGNPTHPLTRGASDMFLQASVLNVYDPDRSRGIVMQKDRQGPRVERPDLVEKTWTEFAAVAKGIDKSTLVVLSEASRSPSVTRLRNELKAAGVRWFEYEAAGSSRQRAGALQVFGKPLRAVPHLDQAQLIVSLDADLFHGEPLSIMFNRDFAAGRKLRDSAKAADAAMNRLYVVEAGFSITGTMADHRRGVKPSEVGAMLRLIAGRLGVAGLAAEKTALPRELQDFADALAKDIKALGDKKAVFVAGWRQPAAVHATVAAINAALSAPVDYFDDADADWKSHDDQLADFAKAITGAKTVLILGANPVLTAPADLHIADLLAGKGQVNPTTLTIHVGTHLDETALACQWHIPQAHYLEAWGDVRTFDGTVSIAQPLIEPIFGGKSTIEFLDALLGHDSGGEAIVRQTAKSDYLKANYSNWTWKKALHDGIVEGSAATPAKLPTKPYVPEIPQEAPKGLELALYLGAAHDGRFANNGWLMELPDPMTRVCWENPLIISPKTAEKLGVQSDDVVWIKAGNNPDLEAVVYVLPGQPDDTLSIAVGYGRANLGNIAQDTGVNAYALCTNQGMFVSGVQVKKFGDKTKIVACVQDHHAIDTVGKNRLNTIVPELVVEGTFEQYKKKPQLGTRKIVALSIFDEYKYDKGQPWVMAKWGMAIDLTACTGCSACVIACQAENNIPVVGKQMVYRGREMHWLRIDRYFKFGRDEKTGKSESDLAQGAPLGAGIEPDHVQVVHQPLLCMHCENAPCEEVCPVAATTHSHEGLNMMTYNRCIGTRYCSNNCPYKVRRFNFFDFNAGTNFGEKGNLYTPNLLRDDLDELVKMQKNPQVTVRSRGVMEKCTYCVQRIEKARIELRAANRSQADTAEFKDGAVVTACQQSCPTQAIVFGDLNDKNSQVTKLHALAQSYGLLDPELNTKPRTQYLAKVRNNAPGLDQTLYNEHTASEGWFFENKE